VNINSFGREKLWLQNGFSEEQVRKVHPIAQSETWPCKSCCLLSIPKTFLRKFLYHLSHGLADLDTRENSCVIYFALTVLDNGKVYHAVPRRPDDQLSLPCHSAAEFSDQSPAAPLPQHRLLLSVIFSALAWC